VHHSSLPFFPAPCYGRAMCRTAFVLCTLFVSLLLCLRAPVMAQQEDDRVVRIDPVIRNGQLIIDADIDFTPGDAWHRAMQQGLPAYFTADLEVVSPRWWWFDKTVVSTHKTWKIAYNALTRQWRVGSGDLALPAPSLDDALSAVRHVRNWAVANTADLGVDKTLRGRLRLRLDTSLLAQPLQLNTLNRPGWTLSTPWKTFNFSVVAGASDPS